MTFILSWDERDIPKRASRSRNHKDGFILLLNVATFKKHICSMREKYFIYLIQSEFL